VAGQGSGLLFLFSGNKEEERMINERERRSGGIYKGWENIIIMLPLLIKAKENAPIKLRLNKAMVASRPKELDAGMKAASRRKCKRLRFNKRTKVIMT